MLHAMSRFALLALLIACGNGSKSPSDQEKTPSTQGTEPEKISVPGGTKGVEVTGAPAARAPEPQALTPEMLESAKNPQFHLQPEEGKVTVDNAQAAAGAQAIATVKVEPGEGYNMATDYPIKKLLENPNGVTVEKTFLTAGGRSKEQGDATTLSEKSIAFAVRATPAAKGSYEIKGVFKFGVCQAEACYPRTAPITIQVAAN